LHWASGVLATTFGIVALGVVAPAQELTNEAKLDSIRSVDGTSIVYGIAGHGEPAIVFVHGWACDRSLWRDQVAYFAKSRQVITLDLAGHGSSGRGRTEWTIERFAEDVAAVVRASGAKKVILVGHSLGGPVVVEAALRVPEQTVAVV